LTELLDLDGFEVVEAASQYLDQLKAAPTTPPPMWLLTDEVASEAVADVEVLDQPFATRFDAANYLQELLSAANINKVDRDAGLWSWLTLLFFDQVCPLGKAGERDAGETARYIPALDLSRRYYRHLLLAARGKSRAGVACGFCSGSSLSKLPVFAQYSSFLRLDPEQNPRRVAARDFCHGLLGPYLIYVAHRDCPERLRGLLTSRLDVATAETYRLFIENPPLVACSAVVSVATKLYYDRKKGVIRRGAGSKEEGGCRRLVDFLQQLDCTFDLQRMSESQLLSYLPTEFRRFIPRQLELI